MATFLINALLKLLELGLRFLPQLLDLYQYFFGKKPKDGDCKDKK